MRLSNFTSGIYTSTPMKVTDDDEFIYRATDMFRKHLSIDFHLTEKVIDEYMLSIGEFEFFRSLIKCPWIQIETQDLFLYRQILRRTGLSPRIVDSKTSKIIKFLKCLGWKFNKREYKQFRSMERL